MLLLDEPTNDLDIETLNVLEDFLDGWPGTLVVVSHDRYFLERVTDSVWALLGDGQISMLPRGVDEYLERRRHAGSCASVAARQCGPAPQPSAGATGDHRKPKVGSAEERAARKTVARLDKQLARIAAREAELNAEILEHAHDYERLAELSAAADRARRREGRRSSSSGSRRPSCSSERLRRTARAASAAARPAASGRAAAGRRAGLPRRRAAPRTRRRRRPCPRG